jgi:hypothetical protein
VQDPQLTIKLLLDHHLAIRLLQEDITVKQQQTINQGLLKLQVQQIQPTTITTLIQETLELCLQHLLLASLLITKRDMNCERMKLAKLLFDFNMKVSAVAILCQDSRVFQSMIHAGTPCPFFGKIGSEAEDEWKKYEQQRPDYEEYTKALRYMERVDNKIANEQELEANPNAQIITDGNGNRIQLGNE